MNTDTHTIDRIVAGVLNQLSADGNGVRGDVTTEGDVSREATPIATERESTVINEHVITADVLLDALNDGASRIVVAERAIVTPAAGDVARERGVEIVRSGDRFPERRFAAHLKCTSKQDAVAAMPLRLIVVRSTDAVDRLCENLHPKWERELLGCPDDAAAFAISAVCRGDAAAVVILAEQAHRVACLSNRNESINAVAVSEIGGIRNIKQQLRANVWCVDPTGRSWFELRNLLRAIGAQGEPR